MKRFAILLTSALAFAAPAFAGEDDDSPSYSNFIAEYINISPDSWDSGDGGRVIISYSPWNHVYFTGSALWADVDGLDFTSYSAGVGTWYALLPNLHIAGDIGVCWQDLDVPGWDNDAGLYVNPHLRWKPTRMVELQAGGMWKDVDNDEEWVGWARVLVQIFPGVDLTASISGNGDSETYSGGVRINF